MKEQVRPQARGRWIPWAAVIGSALGMWFLLMLLAPKADAATTYPPSPPPPTNTIPPPADTGFHGRSELLGFGALMVVGLGATAVARRRAKAFEA